MKVFDSGRLIEDLQRLLSSDHYPCDHHCILRNACDNTYYNELVPLCLEDKEKFKQTVIDIYSHEVEENV